MTVARGCHVYMGLTGTTEQAKTEGVFKFNSLTVADQGELTSGDDVDSKALTFNVGELKIKGGGNLHMKRLVIKAGNMTVDDLGVLRGDLHDPKYELLKHSQSQSLILIISNVYFVKMFIRSR